jgi:serine/threonine protein kinase
VRNGTTRDAGSGVLASGRYVLQDRLGGGGSSDVYRGFDTQLTRPVAVKMFRPDNDATAERRFDEEARLLAGLNHPGLVTVYDIGVEDDRAFMVLQLVEGVTLRGRLSYGPLPLDQVVQLGARLASVLAHVHSSGIIHRDLKPGNVLIDGDHIAEGGANVYLTDFGISRLIDGGAHLTATGLMVGTAAYMAPEQVRGEEVRPAADVYTLGLVLLECVTGRREYAGTTTECALARLSRSPQVPADLPAPLGRLLSAMTADDPAARPSALHCAEALDPEIVALTAGDASQDSDPALLAWPEYASTGSELRSADPDRMKRDDPSDGALRPAGPDEETAAMAPVTALPPYGPRGAGRRPTRLVPRRGLSRWLTLAAGAAALAGALVAWPGTGSTPNNVPSPGPSPTVSVTAPAGASGQQAEPTTGPGRPAGNADLTVVTSPAADRPKPDNKGPSRQGNDDNGNSGRDSGKSKKNGSGSKG